MWQPIHVRHAQQLAKRQGDAMTKITAYFEDGYVVEAGGLITGPFDSPERAIDWYREELDIELTLTSKGDSTCNPSLDTPAT